MPCKTNKSSNPAPTPHPYRPPSQAPPPPANPTAARLTVSDVETLLKPEYSSTGLMTLAFWLLDSQENRAIMDAICNRGIAPAVAIANAEASSLAKGNVKGPSGQLTGIGAAPPAVKTPPFAAASVLSLKHPISPGSSSSGPSVAAVLVCGSDDSSMALDYEDATTPRPASPADEEHLDSKEAVKYITELISDSVGLFVALSSSNWKSRLLEGFPALMDDDLNVLHTVFVELAPSFRNSLFSAVDAPAPHVILWDAQPPAESAKSKPPKKVWVDPAPPSDVTPSASLVISLAKVALT
ncbi:hypothetical protein Agabi119p4_9131 [Agaricus bisporus var. burnettii]|uniref:Uncharacterized protein n=1 Tax=Agaricus bisporus var. burnettii TaxID=192524 RepID=A0A8H7C5G1_AGABI|nr:hypothetical protein Agabi119p4_9131 [Agaricus bisporus var. burnettii]